MRIFNSFFVIVFTKLLFAKELCFNSDSSFFHPQATMHQSLPSQSLLPALPLVDLGGTPTHASPLHAPRSPDVISSASSTPAMQHPSAIPEVASEALRRGLRDQPRPNLMEQQVPLQPALRLSCAGHEGSAKPSLLLESLTGRDASGTGAGWPTAPDLTRETPGGAKARCVCADSISVLVGLRMQGAV